ncbi:MAG TPA: VTT domain-containing protein [Vicinamibacteria bacterium]|nr:VTT domain-containing protein [Vicinamibacteria bacterium]
MADRLLDALAALPTVPTYLALMLLSALENVFPPLPADVAVALGAFLAHRGEIQAPLLGLLCWLANMASSAGVYAFARRHGGAFREGPGRRLVPPEAMAAIEEAYRKHGTLGIFLTRFLPGVRAAVLPFAGLAGVAPLAALAPAGLASALWYAFLIGVGTALGENWGAVKTLVEDVNRALAVVGAVFVVAFVVWLRRRTRRAGGPYGTNE